MSNKRLLNPYSGMHSFGMVPEKRHREHSFPSGHIYLPLGKHWGPNRGFGACHIWAEHEKEMRAIGMDTEGCVPCYVARIVFTGTPLYFEGGKIAQTRLIAVRASSGTAILELKTGRDDNFWSIVTAFSANKKHGVQIGTVLDVIGPQ